MRCMTLAIIFSAFGWIASATPLKGEESLSPSIPSQDLPINEISSSASSRVSFVALASNYSTPEITSPSDLSPSAPANSSNLAPSSRLPSPIPSQVQDLSSFHGYQPPLPFGPSRITSTLQYMTCDPHSCPSIWQGYEAQRAADLAKKCAPPCSGHCGAGCGCGRSSLYGSPCVIGGGRTVKSLNRYRPTPAASCSSCGNASCDGTDSSSNSCPSCQASKPKTHEDRFAQGPTPAASR